MGDPQVWWRMPGESVLWRLVAGPGADAFVFAPFDEGPRLQLKGRAEVASYPEVGEVNAAGATFELEDQLSREAYTSAIGESLKAIAAGAFEKVVVSRHSLEESEASPEAVFAAKCAQYPDAFVYLWDHPDTGVWLGATPELLVGSTEVPGQWQTVSLAGTLRLAEQSDWTEKERAEQAVVTEYIARRLSATGASDLAMSLSEDVRYGDISHLQTRIRFSVDADLLTLAEALHPTPAVAGKPLAAALDYIRKVEPVSRRYYSGYLGWMKGETLGALFVNLRCMWWTPRGVVAFAGAGIVKGSDPDLEWLETEAKLDSIRNALSSDGAATGSHLL